MFHPKQSPGTSTPVPTVQIPTRSRVDNNMDIVIVIAVVVVIVVILIVAGETLVRALHLHVAVCSKHVPLYMLACISCIIANQIYATYLLIPTAHMF